MLTTLKKRTEFLRVAKEGLKMVTPSLILTAAQNLCADTSSPLAGEKKTVILGHRAAMNRGSREGCTYQSPPRIGFTTTKKLGHAHIRNKARRRMRALARAHLANFLPAADYVLIGRHNTADIEFAQLEKDFLWGLKKLNCLLTEKKDENNS